MRILTLLPQNWPVTLCRNRCFLVALCHLIVSRRPNLDQQTFPSVIKNTGVVLVPYFAYQVYPYNYIFWCGFFGGSWVSFVMTDEFLVRFTTIASKINISWSHCLPLLIFKSFLTQSNGHLESNNSLRLSFTNI